MSHHRLESIASSLTSCSSEASIELYEERLKPGIDAIRNLKSRAPLQELVSDAEKIIDEKFAPDPRSTYKYKKGSEEISVKLDKVMTAMLAYAEESGGDSGKNYVASAILTCSKEEDVVGALAALGTTWLTHFLFNFKTSRGHRHGNHSRFVTPTVDKTATHLSEELSYRKKSFADDVIRRDGYTCVLTGFQNHSHPKPTKGTPRVYLVGAHILHRVIGAFDSDHNSRSFKSAVTTFHILVNFTHLSAQTMDELHGQLDNPSNGMTLQRDAHDAFDSFCWCLKRTEKKHVYDLKIFENQGILRQPENNRISFEDHSNDFLSDSAHKRIPPGDMPDPHHIAIHAAIAGVLNMSGAGSFFDELLKKYKDDEGNVPVLRSWPELETLMGEELIRESVIEAFQSVKVH